MDGRSQLKSMGIDLESGGTVLKSPVLRYTFMNINSSGINTQLIFRCTAGSFSSVD